ncbi:RhoGEF domain-containing protein [Cavenderia fasciculata]|uniref:RhoGEF domain-containing protein n=1 Tax=Cavenderia fasciculata TaxID=261658 RepID=F4QFQ3_CACFS|nr:RhoGEF domain-containing protein [Cavenderia fasciculata]EGG13506.1 RhoGEF domain-containing protein [Cavenderia fasciculata]|eukprot:XP_004350210.1 RhoGEF domain-containing protein [Cavenderia fasciculata]
MTSFIPLFCSLALLVLFIIVIIIYVKLYALEEENNHQRNSYNGADTILIINHHNDNDDNDNDNNNDETRRLLSINQYDNDSNDTNNTTTSSNYDNNFFYESDSYSSNIDDDDNNNNTNNNNSHQYFQLTSITNNIKSILNQNNQIDPLLLLKQKAAIIIQKYVRGWLVRIHYADFFKKIKYRKFIIKEIINFEKTYISKLTMLIDHLKTPLLDNHYRSMISLDKVNQLFSNIDEILHLHKSILETFTSSQPPYLVGKIYIDILPSFKIYIPYVKNYNNAFKIYSSLADDEEFSQLIEIFGFLPSYLILPIQQTPRYVLLFSDLLKHTNPQNQDYDSLKVLIDEVRATASSINQCISTSVEDDDEEDNEVMAPRPTSKNNHHSTPPRRPASASSKHRPRNSIAMHKEAINSMLQSPPPTSSHNPADYAHLPSYLRPTKASAAWSRQKVEYTPQPVWKSSGTGNDYITNYTYQSTPYVEKGSPLFIDRTPSKGQPVWRPNSPSPKSFNYPKENYTRSTKVQPNRPVSPPPKPNFFNYPDLSSSSSSSSSSLSSSNTTSPMSSGISSPSISSTSSSEGVSSFKPPLGKKQLSSISLSTTTTTTTSNHSSGSGSNSIATTPPISPNNHLSTTDRVKNFESFPFEAGMMFVHSKVCDRALSS